MKKGKLYKRGLSLIYIRSFHRTFRQIKTQLKFSRSQFYHFPDILRILGAVRLYYRVQSNVIACKFVNIVAVSRKCAFKISYLTAVIVFREKHIARTENSSRCNGLEFFRGEYLAKFLKYVLGDLTAIGLFSTLVYFKDHGDYRKLLFAELPSLAVFQRKI